MTVSRLPADVEINRDEMERLAAAVVRTAVTDVRRLSNTPIGPRGDAGGSWSYHTIEYLTGFAHPNGAREWIAVTADSHDMMSFGWWCSFLRLDAGAVADRLDIEASAHQERVMGVAS